MLALELGHTDQDLIFHHHRELVKPERAATWWNVQLAVRQIWWRFQPSFEVPSGRLNFYFRSQGCIRALSGADTFRREAYNVSSEVGERDRRPTNRFASSLNFINRTFRRRIRNVRLSLGEPPWHTSATALPRSLMLGEGIQF
jgi:hypothetical protein